MHFLILVILVIFGLVMCSGDDEPDGLALAQKELSDIRIFDRMRNDCLTAKVKDDHCDTLLTLSWEDYRDRDKPKNISPEKAEKPSDASKEDVDESDMGQAAGQWFFVFDENPDWAEWERRCLQDGQHPGLVREVKAAMRKPNSFFHASTHLGPSGTVGYEGKHLYMTYRGKNDFGNMVSVLVTARPVYDCNVYVISEELY